MAHTTTTNNSLFLHHCTTHKTCTGHIMAHRPQHNGVSPSPHNPQCLHWSEHGPQTTTFLHHCTAHKTCTGQVWPQIMTTTVFFHQCTTHNACTGQIMAHNTTVFLHHRTAHKTCTGQIWPQIMTTTQQGFSITAQPTTLALARSWPTDHNRQQTVFLHHCTTHNAYIL